MSYQAVYTDMEMAIGKAFVDILRQDMSEGVWQKIRYLNAIDDHNCASHVFCDANTVMEMAFNTVLKREPLLPCDVTCCGTCYVANGCGGACITNEQVEADMRLWNNAWDYGSLTYLTATRAEVSAYECLAANCR